MNKYQVLSELCNKMIQQRIKGRNLWALMDNEFNINKEFKEYSDNCDEEYQKSYVYKVIELLTKKS